MSPHAPRLDGCNNSADCCNLDLWSADISKVPHKLIAYIIVCKSTQHFHATIEGAANSLIHKKGEKEHLQANNGN